MQKIMGIVLPQTGVDAYLFYTFASAFLILIIANPKRPKVTKKVSVCALGSAVALYIISVVMTYLAADLPSVILFPLFNGSGIILVTLLFAVLFKEKITQLEKVCKEEGYTLLVTADHGNAEQLLDYETGAPFTAHTTNPVPFSVIGKDCSLREGGKLCDIAPTMLKIMELEQPAEMDGASIIK